ncbi:MAG TPA: toll/interleukin-1 receptor domain-containing protein [Bacteroidia bacterium]|nr:toll/interleukin-1 receptor domain-containing protein [Bacteroidia bacterium]
MTETPAYDVFISHAFEDKNSFANELAMELTKSGLKVWYSGYQLKLGDSIAGSINQALKGATFGIVVISPIYLKKQWAMNELNALFAQETEQIRILPILHNITVEGIKEHFPILADRYTISSEAGMDTIVKKVWQAMGAQNRTDLRPPSAPPKVEQSADKNNSSKSKKNKTGTSTHTNVNKNSNSVTVNTGSSKIVILIICLLIAGLALIYALAENTQGTPPSINNSNLVQPD